MFESFTGTSRRPRQVNLSGRSSNPFATGQHAVAAAQRDRVHRQQQRDRLHASSRIQKTWRGHASRRRTFKIWRQIWDEQEAQANGPYPTADESLRQLKRLMLFFSPKSEPSDVSRICWYGTRQITTNEFVECSGDVWKAAYAKLRSACTTALRARRTSVDAGTDRALLGVMAFSARQAKFSTSKEATEYYETLTSAKGLPKDHLQGALLAPLKGSSLAYAGLVVLLSKPLPEDMLVLLKAAVEPAALSQAVSDLGANISSTSARERLWLLGNMIALVGHSGSLAFKTVIARLLGSLADVVDFEGLPKAADNVSFDHDVLSEVTVGIPLNTFLRRQTGSLVNEESVRSLLLLDEEAKNSAQVLGRYALTLLRCFPRRADDIRIWLDRGPAGRESHVNPIDYLLTATKSTRVFAEIASSSRGVVALLKNMDDRQYRDDWTIILVFLELLTWKLQIMDDEEFIRSANLDDIAALVTFLKNLGFTLCFDASELNDAEPLPPRDASIGTFGRTGGRFSAAYTAPSIEHKPLLIGGLPGLTVDYLKGVVTGILRAIHDRDARRHFLPSGHWLMTERFDMTSFIPEVVDELEKARDVGQDEVLVDPNELSDDETTGIGNARMLNAHARSLRTKRYLESVAPRLEIVQNMPFFIPFHTRVQIFRQSVRRDQKTDRNGNIDDEQWRQSMMFQPQNGMHPGEQLARHHAKIKRTQEFTDAFEQFYQLGPDFKKPIQITFVDTFDMPEAGIDGGGVTKEFLTSVISQGFGEEPVDGKKFFVENDKHLLYPNPTLFQDMNVKARKLGLEENSEAVKLARRQVDRQYQFLGRIIGKCLYEGILVDVNFAGFFLKKWALTGNIGDAPQESGYRATINDVRELDEDLYRGLLQLKYAEDAEALGLTFTVDDEYPLIPNGADTAVTNDNRRLYLYRLASYRLKEQSWRQTKHFLDGLRDIIPPSWLSMFNQTELQTLIAGDAAGIDVQDLRRNTLYGGTYVIGDDGQEHPSVQMFWRVMQEMPDEEQRKVLKFVTSTPRGPLLGFSYLNPKFSIRDSGSDENRFPTTSTCVNLLKLPMYKSEATLREKLLEAVNSGAGFDLS